MYLETFVSSPLIKIASMPYQSQSLCVYLVYHCAKVWLQLLIVEYHYKLRRYQLAHIDE